MRAKKRTKRTKDLGIVIVSEYAAFWKRVLAASGQEIKDAKNSIMFNEEIVRLANRKLEEEK